jgi:hypothetical protein
MSKRDENVNTFKVMNAFVKDYRTDRLVQRTLF